jgi:hypothetical protein
MLCSFRAFQSEPSRASASNASSEGQKLVLSHQRCQCEPLRAELRGVASVRRSPESSPQPGLSMRTIESPRLAAMSSKFPDPPPARQSLLPSWPRPSWMWRTRSRKDENPTRSMSRGDFVWVQSHFKHTAIFPLPACDQLWCQTCLNVIYNQVSTLSLFSNGTGVH